MKDQKRFGIRKRNNMKFHLKADCSFQADNIEEAYDLLVIHFMDLSVGDASCIESEFDGEINLKPFKNENESNINS